MAINSWKQFDLTGRSGGGNGVASANGGIAAVSRIPGSMEVWWINQDGSVHDAFWYDNAQWRHLEIAPPGSASANSGIAAVSRIPSHMDVWWIDEDGSVQDAFWYDNAQWKRYEIAPPDSASANSGIAAVSRIPSSMEVWWIGTDGSVQDAFWYDNAKWKRLEIPGSASTHSKIAAVSRIPSSMEVWFIGTDGSVQDAFWYELSDLVLDVQTTQRSVLGGRINVSGKGFTRSNQVNFFVDGLVRRTAPMAIGFAKTDSNGTFQGFVYDAKCWNGQVESATVRAVDAATGRTATGETWAFTCP